MHNRIRLLLPLAAAAVVFTASRAAEENLLPPGLTKEQRANLLSFLQKQEKPDRYVPPDAKVVGSKPGSVDLTPETKPSDKPIKQYMVQIISHRPVPGQEEVKQVDVYYYRPNPEKGKQGITVHHTVDVTTGKQIGPTEVLLNRITPLSRDELAEAATLAKEKSPAVGELYKNTNTVKWEFLPVMITRKHEMHEPGDRVVRFVFTGVPAGEEVAPAPVRVLVNLTRGIVATEAR